MPKVPAKCPNCKRTINVGHQLLGRPVACPACRAVVSFAADEPPAPAQLPAFNKPFKTDSIFDDEGPTSVFDEPKPKPSLPAAPVAVAIAPPPVPDNPFDFSGAAETFTKDAPAAKPPSKKDSKREIKKESKAGRSKPGIPAAPDNPFGGSDMELSIGDGAPALPAGVAGPQTTASGELRSMTDDVSNPPPELQEPNGRRSGAPPLITWIFLAWALLATGAAFYFATQKPAPAKPAAAPSAAQAPAPDKEKADKADRKK